MSIYEKTKCARALLYWAANNNGNEAYYLEDRMYAVADNGMVIVLTADSYDEAIRKAKARQTVEQVTGKLQASERSQGEGKFECCIKIKDLIAMLLEFDMNEKATICTTDEYNENNIVISITDMRGYEE